jgi:DNA repair protein RadC
MSFDFDLRLSGLVMFTVRDGDPHPTAEDIRETERVGMLLCRQGLRLADHVIVGSGSYFSFAEGREICGR